MAGAGAGWGGEAADGGGTPDDHGYAVARNRGVRSAEKWAARLDLDWTGCTPGERAEQPGAAAAREGVEGVGRSGAT